MENPVQVESSRLRLPPHAIDAERAVLGGLMIDPAAWDKIADQVVSE
ncbi:MAG: DnaB-like helicase N-terminal domain-containing protein, partial [bacterium]